MTLCIPFSENVWMKRTRRVLRLTAESSITSSSWWYSKPSWKLLSAMILMQLDLHSEVVSVLLQACSSVCQPPRTKNKGQQVQSNNKEASQCYKAANQTGLLGYLQVVTVVLSYPAALVAWAVTVQLDIPSDLPKPLAVLLLFLVPLYPAPPPSHPKVQEVLYTDYTTPFAPAYCLKPDAEGCQCGQMYRQLPTSILQKWTLNGLLWKHWKTRNIIEIVDSW